MPAKGQRLDVDELLHLAIHASQQNQYEQTIEFLKHALEIDGSNAKVHYLLGAQHAEIGLYDRAAEDMARAIELDPTLVTARFQLGLLYLTAGRVTEAANTWLPLNTLGVDHPLYLFKAGLEHLVRDEFDACIEALQKGINANKINNALNTDMQRIINDVKNRKVATDTPDTTVKSNKTGHVLLSAYQNPKDDK